MTRPVMPRLAHGTERNRGGGQRLAERRLACTRVSWASADGAHRILVAASYPVQQASLVAVTFRNVCFLPASDRTGTVQRWKVEPPVGIEPTTCSLRVLLPTVPGRSPQCIWPGSYRFQPPPARPCSCLHCYENCYKARGSRPSLTAWAAACARTHPATLGHPSA